LSGFRRSRTIDGTKAAAETVFDRFSGGDFDTLRLLLGYLDDHEDRRLVRR
jgi:hypothetical protein